MSTHVRIWAWVENGRHAHGKEILIKCKYTIGKSRNGFVTERLICPDNMK
jgi:hypothetical protein